MSSWGGHKHTAMRTAHTLVFHITSGSDSPKKNTGQILRPVRFPSAPGAILGDRKISALTTRLHCFAAVVTARRCRPRIQSTDNAAPVLCELRFVIPTGSGHSVSPAGRPNTRSTSATFIRTVSVVFGRGCTLRVPPCSSSWSRGSRCAMVFVDLGKVGQRLFVSFPMLIFTQLSMASAPPSLPDLVAAPRGSGGYPGRVQAIHP